MSKDSLFLLMPSPAIASGGGRLRASSRGATLTLEVVDAMLEADRFLLWPLLWPPWLLSVDARDRPFGVLTRSVRICLWNLVPVAASESPGMSSLT